MPAHLSPTGLLIFVVAAAVLALRLRSMRRVRRLRLETWWIVPVLLMVALGSMLAEHPPRSPLAWAGVVAALAVGAFVGWWRARAWRLHVDPATHTLNQQASPTALLVVLALIVARQGLRYEAAARGLDILQVTTLGTAFTTGLLGATRAELFVRGRRLLAQARGSAIGPTSSR